MNASKLTDRAGRRVALGPELARGGEGAVFDVRDRPELVAKLYHEAPTPARADKLKALAELCTPELLSTAAWPRELLFQGRGQIVGFLMPKLSARHDLHVLYGPRTRLRIFPDASWKFLIRAAINLAHAFAAVHREGHVIGDVNDRVALVSSDALVHLVDCDSFQVRHRDRVHTCDVGIPLYQPPELQQIQSFRGLERTHEHDRFGLAVLLFQVLFLARHPFSGRYSGPGEMPIEEAIRGSLFAYGRNARTKNMSPPPSSLSLGTVSNELATLYERAFAPDAVRVGRPSAEDWCHTLKRFEQSQTTCQRNSNHSFWNGLAQCPICALERSAGLALFGFPAPSLRPQNIDVRALWAAIQAISAPEQWSPDATLPAQQVAVSSLGTEIRRARSTSKRRRMVIVGVACLFTALAFSFYSPIFIAAILVFILGWRVTRIDRCDAWQLSSTKLDEADEQISNLHSRWHEITNTEQFAACLSELNQARNALEQLPVQRAHRIAVLERDRHLEQLADYLDTHRIARADIQGIGPTRKTTLESYGIETAADIEKSKLKSVPGFGDALSSRLIQWRRDVQARFVFDPRRPIDPWKIDQLDRDLEAQRRGLVRTLSEGPDRLRRAKAELEQRRAPYLSALLAASAARDQARCDLGIRAP